MDELHETLKNIEAVLVRLEKRFKEHFVTYAESKAIGDHLTELVYGRQREVGKEDFH